MTRLLVQAGGTNRIAYVVSRFPKLSETFILREMVALEQLGWHIQVFPFIRLQEAIRQPQAARWLARLDRSDCLPAIAMSNLSWLLRSPMRFLTLYGMVVRYLWRRPDELLRGLVAVARGANWAQSVRQRRIAHVHAHFALHPTVAAMAMAHLAEVGFSFTCHAQDVYRRQDMLAEKVRRARFVVTISRLLRDRYLAPLLGPQTLSRVHVVRCGVDLSRFSMRTRPSPQAPMTILTVARLTEKKGLRYLIDACAHLRDHGYSVRCRIIGDGPLYDALQRQIVAAGLATQVSLDGPRSEDEVRQVLLTAAVFVLPSIVTVDGDMEGVPVSLMEAMACGVPVIATRTGAIEELVADGRTGLLVPGGDSLSLARAIERLSADSALAARLVTAARCRIEEEYDLHQNAARLDRLFREAVARGTGYHPAAQGDALPDRWYDVRTVDGPESTLLGHGEVHR